MCVYFENFWAISIQNYWKFIVSLWNSIIFFVAQEAKNRWKFPLSFCRIISSLTLSLFRSYSFHILPLQYGFAEARWWVLLSVHFMINGLVRLAEHLWNVIILVSRLLLLKLNLAKQQSIVIGGRQGRLSVEQKKWVWKWKHLNFG